jgi:hypothetical protein
MTAASTRRATSGVELVLKKVFAVIPSPDARGALEVKETLTPALSRQRERENATPRALQRERGRG